MKAAAFETMWNSTILACRVPFEDAWEVESEDMVRPKHGLITINDLKLSFSTSENALYTFFLGVFGGHRSSHYGMMDALLYWRPTTPEGQMILQWLDNPFWF